jgi:hypothetical protein
MTNEEKFGQAIEGIQEARAPFLSRLESLSQTQLDFKPSESSWSIGEVIHHVGLAEKMVQDNLQELLESGPEKQGVTKKVSFEELPMTPSIIPRSFMQLPPLLIPFSIMTRFTPREVQSFLLANPILKITTAPALEPQAGMPRGELAQYMRETRDATLRLLEPARSWDLSQLYWEHPMMGKHDVYGTLGVMADHDRRHRIQMEGIQKNANFPAS